MQMTNRWNRRIYRFWAPVYDRLFDRLLFAAGRKRVFELLQLRADERVLLVGIGTGADVPYLPCGARAVGIDLSPEMLIKAAGKQPTQTRITLAQADAQILPVKTASMDAAILSLILSVVPDAQTCWRETLRALRPDGRVIIFDKFLPDSKSPRLLRSLFNFGARLLGTDINRRLSTILASTDYVLLHDEPSLLNGMYRIIMIRAPHETPIE